MNLRDALLQKGWDSFQLLGESDRWDNNILSMITKGNSPDWLDKNCTLMKDGSIIDCNGDSIVAVPYPTNGE